MSKSGKADLAKWVYQYYLAISVLKHAKGASYRELLETPRCLFVVKRVDEIVGGAAVASVGLVDVTAPGFFDGLVETIVEAYHFLEDGPAA